MYLNYFYYKGEYDPSENQGFRPAPAHRLDRNTSGLVLFAKNLVSLQELEDLFKDKEEIDKIYLALVKGHLDEPMMIDAPLLKDEKSGLVKISKLGKSALTRVEPFKYYDDLSLVKVQIFTGRTHQIRVHLSFKGFPVVGDGKYGDFTLNKEFKDIYKFDNQFLHAYQIHFKKIGGHLSYLTNKTFVAQVPKKEQEILDKLGK